MQRKGFLQRIAGLSSSMYANIIGAIIFAFIIFGMVMGSVGLYSFNNEFRNEYAVSTYHMADAAAALVNGDHIDEYLQGQETEEYETVRKLLNEYCDRMSVSLIYVIKVDTSDYGRFVSIVNPVNNSVDDTEYKEWELGYKRNTTNDEYRAKYRAIYEEGSPFETVYRERTTDGQHPHITTLVPVKDSSGRVTAILCMQRPMRELVDAAKPYLLTVAVSTLILAALASLAAASYTRDGLLEPVRKVSEEAARFAKENSKGELLGEISRFAELRDLAASIDTMETDMVSYMDELTTVTSERERIETEISLANSIQMNSVPHTFPAFPDRDDFEIYGYMSPARGVGGDFYNYFLLDEDHLMMCIGDVSGKGVPGALFMMVTNILLTGRARAGGTPAEIMDYVNRDLCRNNTAQMFVSVWLGILELSTGRLTACNAGHEYPILKQPGSSYEMIKDKHGLVAAAMEDVSYVDYEIKLRPGSKLFLYTDGVPEATDTKEEMFGTARTVDTLNLDIEASPEQTLINIRNAVDDFASGTEQFDDLTMLCLEYRGREEDKEAGLVIDASVANLPDVQDYIGKVLEGTKCPAGTRMQIDLAVEEIFVNIAKYAYAPGNGKVSILAYVTGDPPELTVTFRDRGIPYDPTAGKDPDITLPASERAVGGLGIYMAKKAADEIRYEYTEGQNVLTIRKQIRETGRNGDA